MTPTKIKSALETANQLPAAAMRAGIVSADDIAPDIIAVVELAANGVYLIPRQERLLFWGIHVLAGARRTELFKPLLRLLRQDCDYLDRLLGAALTETLSGLLTSVYDGDADALIGALEDERIDGYVKWALFGVLVRATFDGQIPREITCSFLDRFERDNLAEANDAAWEGWQDAIRLLALDDLAPRVRTTWIDGRNEQAKANQQDWEDALAAAIGSPTDETRFMDDRLHPLDDPIAALEWTSGLSKHEKTSDRGGGTALDQDEIDWLQGFIESDAVPEGAMSVETLDGYFAALIAGPEVVLPSEYLPEIWDGDGPVYDSLEQAEHVMTLLMRHWNSIASRLGDRQPYAPLVANSTLRAQPWADGFMRGVSMRMGIWDQHLTSNDMLNTFLGHILMLAVSIEETAKEGVTHEKREKLVEDLPLAVLGVHLYWREHADGITKPTLRSSKVGRNVPCPCGSGKKYKRCCGASGATLH